MFNIGTRWDFMPGLDFEARRILAGPFYFMAFVFHLLCAGLTVLAAKIAKDPH